MRPVGISQNGQVCDDIGAFFEDLRERLILPISIVADDTSNHHGEAGLRRLPSTRVWCFHGMNFMHSEPQVCLRTRVAE